MVHAFEEYFSVILFLHLVTDTDSMYRAMQLSFLWKVETLLNDAFNQCN